MHVPTLRVVPLDAQLPTPEHAPRCVAAVFVSANAVRCGMGALKRRWNPLPRCYAVGKATQRALAECGVDALAPTDGDGAAALLRRPELAAPIDGDVLLLRGAHGLAALGDSLAARGATVHSCALYRRARCATHRRRLRDALRLGSLHAIVATSLFGLESLLALAGNRRALRAVALCVPGARLADHARRLGFRSIILAPQADDASMAGALAGALSPRIRRPRRARQGERGSRFASPSTALAQ